MPVGVQHAAARVDKGGGDTVDDDEGTPSKLSNWDSSSGFSTCK